MKKSGKLNYIYLVILNVLFVLKIKFQELFQFGHRLWWWKYHIYGGMLYCLDSCYRVARRDSQLIKEYTFENFGYGETPPSTLKAMFDPIRPEDYGLFIDIGSGRGLAVFSMYFLYDIRCIGIEILPTHCSRSRKLKRFLRVDKIEIQQKDAVDFDYSRPAIYYSATTSFEDNLLEELERKLKETPPGSIIVMVHWKLEGLEFELFHQGVYGFTWGYDNVYFYRRTPY